MTGMGKRQKASNNTGEDRLSNHFESGIANDYKF
jgi:hypothetical protein